MIWLCQAFGLEAALLHHSLGDLLEAGDVGASHQMEIAALLELPLPTVLSKYHRALKKMRSCLEGDDAR